MHKLFLFRGIYDINQLSHLSTDSNSLIPLIYPNNSPMRRELQACELLANFVLSSSDSASSTLLGILSDSLYARTSLTPSTIRKIICRNPGYDVYVFSPAQYNSRIFFDIWDQGEFWHQGIRTAAASAGLCNASTDIHDKRPNPKTWSFCNYWVANKEYFLKITTKLLEVEAITAANNMCYLPTFYKSQFHSDWNLNVKKDYILLPFLIERVVSWVLASMRPEQIYYWIDDRPSIEQVERVDYLKSLFKVPLLRYEEGVRQGINVNELDRCDFYEYLWRDYNQDLADKAIPGSHKRLKSFYRFKD